MVRVFFYICLTVVLFACKKAEDRRCVKSAGEPDSITVPLDSVVEFRLYKDITYHLYQDTLKHAVIKGGKNLLSFIEVQKSGDTISFHNLNRCHFLRDNDQKVQVDIHYPLYKYIYSEADDSVIFHDTIYSNYLYIEQVLGGGGIRLHTIADKLILVASHGVGSYHVSGEAGYADLRVQGHASGHASGLVCPEFSIDHNATGNLYVNLNQSLAKINIRGTGNVVYQGEPDSLEINKSGDGAVIKQ